MKLVTIVAIIAIFLGNVPLIYAGHRIQDEAEGGKHTADLKRTSAAQAPARGTIVFKVGARSEGQTQIDVRVRIRDLESTGGRGYRVWLVDTFDDAYIPIKKFRTSAQGNADFNAHTRLGDVTRFDKVIVSKDEERKPRSRSRGSTVLTGDVALLED